MMKRKTFFKDETRAGILAGAEELGSIVGRTLGPQGATILLEREDGRPPVITKDGATVAKQVNPTEPIAAMTVSLIKEVALGTNNIAGDGTTTATVLAAELVKLGMESLEKSNANPIQLNHGIQKATKHIISELGKRAKRIENIDDLRDIALISSNSDSRVADMLMDAFKAVKDGAIDVQDTKLPTSSVEIIDGMSLNTGYRSHHFITDAQHGKVILDDCLILITNKKIYAVEDILWAAEEAHKNSNSLLIIAEDVEGEALATMIVNHTRGNIVACAVKAPDYGRSQEEVLDDIAAATGATVFFDGRSEIKTGTIDNLGFAKKVVVDLSSTIIMSGKGDSESMQARVDLISGMLDREYSPVEREKLIKRLGNLTTGVAVLKIGAQSEVEQKELRDRVDDALNAVKAAWSDGIVPGGGVTLWRIAQAKLSESGLSEGERVAYSAIQAPMRRIIENGYGDYSVISGELKPDDDFEIGYDAKTFTFVNMITAGIIDPVKVTRVAVEKSMSIAGTLLSTSGAISVIHEPTQPQLVMLPPQQ